MSWRGATTLLGVVLVAACCTSPTDRAEETNDSPSGTSTSPASIAIADTTTVAVVAVVTTATSLDPTTTATTTPATTTTTTPAATTTTAPAATTTPYRLPVADVDRAGWGDTHAGYPASDIFVGCGAELVAPVNGTILEVRRVNAWDAATDNPATRGGRSISILADDGVRYYLAHFETIVEPLEPGDPVVAGQPLGTMGMTGRASACHVHFAISPPCPGKEWSVRRGVIWPYPYLNAWERGEQLSPVEETAAWVAANPDACDAAMADPNAADS